MKYQTMIDIMMLLLSKRKLTAKQLAERYGISARSVYRYIEELDICGVPVNITRGRYGGITIADTYLLPNGYFTRGEYASTVNALKAMSSQVNDENVTSALEKLQRQHKNEQRDLSVSGNIIVDGGTWGGSKSFSDKMHVCESAVNQSQCLKIDYISRNGEHTKRIIEPHALIFKQNVWYVYAFCHTKQTFRTFKIGRIRSASFTGETFKRKEFTRSEMDINFSYSAEKLTEVVLEIEKSSLADAEDWLGVENIEPRGKMLSARLTLPDDGGLVNKILSYGGAVRVIEPEELKEKVRAAAERIAKNS